MSDHLQHTSTDAVIPELEVRLLALLNGEASDFERDQLEQLLATNSKVAEVYAELQRLHQALLEIGSGEASRLEEPWQLSPSRREKLLNLFQGQIAAEDFMPQLSVARKEHRKWLTLPFSKSFVSIVAVACVVGLICVLSLPAVQMARQAPRGANPLALFDVPRSAGESASRKATAAAPPAPVPDQPFDEDQLLRNEGADAPVENLEAIKSELQETLSFDLTTPGESMGLDSTALPASGQPLGGQLDGQSGVAGGGYGGERSFGGLAGGYGGFGVYEGRMRESELGKKLNQPTGTAEPAPPASTTESAEWSDNWAARPETKVLGRLNGTPGPRIIVSDESATDKGIAASPQDGSVPRRDAFWARDGALADGLPTDAAPAQTPSGDDSTLYGFSFNQLGQQNFGDINTYLYLKEKSGELTESAISVPPAEAPGGERQLADRAGNVEKLGAVKDGLPPLKQAQQGVEEVAAAVEAFSTFSLHVSDVSFKLAWAALSQGQWPDPAKIRVEEFVNAFDYGDPLPTDVEKVACRMEQARHPFLMQRNLLRIAMRTAATGRTESEPLRLTLLLDNSGSMERVDRQQTLQRALAALIAQLKPIDQVTLISFAERPRLLAENLRGDDLQQLLPMVSNLPSEGGTNIESALQLALEKASEQLSSQAQHRIVLLTDGAVNLGDANPENLSKLVTAMRDAGIAFDAAGISARDLNDEVLETLTRQGDGRYYLLDAAEDAAEGFASQLAGALRPSAMNVKVQIEFNPQRVGQYKLLGFENHRLQTEDFRNDQVDAAELAAAEAGVALYQFEALPEGAGDVGNVSVRFRDVASGQMVERRWPIPYQSHPPRLEQASPSLQLATAAALLAAKLSSDPLGEVVALPTVAAWIAGLPAEELAKTRVQQLQTMIATARQIESSRQ